MDTIKQEIFQFADKSCIKSRNALRKEIYATIGKSPPSSSYLYLDSSSSLDNYIEMIVDEFGCVDLDLH